MRIFTVLACCSACRVYAKRSDNTSEGLLKLSSKAALKAFLFGTRPPNVHGNSARAAALSQSIPFVYPSGQRHAVPGMALDGVSQRILQGVSQGAVGAVVAAGLSAFTEPVVNRVLVNRIPVAQSIKEFDVNKSKEFFKTTLPANFLKFPLFEAVHAAMLVVSLPESLKGAITGILFTTLTLPVTNYRFCKSMDFPVNLDALRKAYLPTVLRDIIYGIGRNKVRSAMLLLFPALMSTGVGSALATFPIVYGSCLLSSPGNELRGYYLQPTERRKPFRDFFNPINYIRSTFVGALIMATGLAVGSVATIPLESLLFNVT